MSADLSFIAPHEKLDAIKFVEEHLGFTPPRMAGYHLAVKIYIRGQDVKKYLDSDGKKMLIDKDIVEL